MNPNQVGWRHTYLTGDTSFVSMDKVPCERCVPVFGDDEELAPWLANELARLKEDADA